jgi:CheY-like chemotaxis protein
MSTGGGTVKTAAGRGRILLVGNKDNNESKARASLLHKAGFDVVSALLSSKPAQSLKEGEFDLVVTDLSVRATLGLDLLNRIRKDGFELPVIIVSEKPTADLFAKAAEGRAFVCHAIDLQRTVEGAIKSQRVAAQRRASVRSFRNRRGDQIDISSVTATYAKNEFGRVLETAIERGAVAITRHETAKAVLVAMDEFNALVRSRDGDLNTLSDEFDTLLSKMQTSNARKGMKGAFDASPAELGQAALMAARKRG